MPKEPSLLGSERGRESFLTSLSAVHVAAESAPDPAASPCAAPSSITHPANDLLSVFITLEFSTFGFYILVVFLRDDVASNEAGLKFFILGVFAAGLLAYGISLVYGETGKLVFSDIASTSTTPGLVIGFVLIFAALGFKIGAVPLRGANPVRAGVVTTPRAYPWSSYRATAGLTEGPAWLTMDWLVEQFGGTRRVAQAKYRAFVAEGSREPTRPWEQVVGQIYLGGEAFVRRAQQHGASRVGDGEIPRSQRQPCWLSPEAVLQRVAQGYGVRVAALVRPTRRPSEARQVALYGLRRWAGEGLPAIARRMGVTYSAVGRRVSAVERRLAEDRRWRTRLTAFFIGDPIHSPGWPRRT